MKPLQLALTGAMLAASLHVFAQSGSGAPATSAMPEASSGAIIMPPATDSGMVKEPPRNVDPGAVSKPPAQVDPEMVRKPAQEPGTMGLPSQGASPKGDERSSAKDDCKGGNDLCKQDSAR